MSRVYHVVRTDVPVRTPHFFIQQNTEHPLNARCLDYDWKKNSKISPETPKLTLGSDDDVSYPAPHEELILDSCPHSTPLKLGLGNSV